MDHDSAALEKEAYQFLTEEKYEDAYRCFKRAARGYQDEHKHKHASLCYASAASCWTIRSGEKAFCNGAAAYLNAAHEAVKASDYEYASLLYKFAAIYFERDMEFSSFSESFFQSKECYRKFLFLSLFNPRKIHNIQGAEHGQAEKTRLGKIRAWIAIMVSSFVWGHGERPFRTLGIALTLVFGCAVIYSWGSFINASGLIKPSFLQALYFSIVTFTTVGYGDFTAYGMLKSVAALEALSGITLVSILTIGLSRKYLRV